MTADQKHAYFEGHRNGNGAIIATGKLEDRQEPWDCGTEYVRGESRELNLLVGGRK